MILTTLEKQLKFWSSTHTRQNIRLKKKGKTTVRIKVECIEVSLQKESKFQTLRTPKVHKQKQPFVHTFKFNPNTFSFCTLLLFLPQREKTLLFLHLHMDWVLPMTSLEFKSFVFLHYTLEFLLSKTLKYTIHGNTSVAMEDLVDYYFGPNITERERNPGLIGQESLSNM